MAGASARNKEVDQNHQPLRRALKVGFPAQQHRLPVYTVQRRTAEEEQAAKPQRHRVVDRVLSSPGNRRAAWQRPRAPAKKGIDIPARQAWGGEQIAKPLKNFAHRKIIHAARKASKTLTFRLYT